MQPIGSYLPDLGKKRHYHSDDRFKTLETAVLDLAAQVKALKIEINALKYKGQCE